MLYSGGLAGLLSCAGSPTGGQLAADDFLSSAPALGGAATLAQGIHIRGAYAHNLRDLDLHLPRGGLTAITGVSGAGKSTLADLLIRLYDPDAGRILIAGRELKDLDLAGWRRRVGYVEQDAFLFNTSVRNNVTLWDESVTDDAIERVARDVQLMDVVRALPQGFDTEVGDRGSKLSGGQRQRVAMARALLRKPSVLIFDEATSALDNLTEHEIHDVIATLRDDAIVLVIAHRYATIRDADIVVVLSQGRVVEQGTPSELLRAHGHFSGLYGVHAMPTT